MFLNPGQVNAFIPSRLKIQQNPDLDSSKARQDLNDALMALNPDFEPLGFTINSLSSCSPGVLNDTLKTTKAAMATILSTIGKNFEKWRQIMCNDEPFSS